MAKFEGIKWASQQMRYLLKNRTYELMDSDAKVFAVSRSIHYGLFLAFEGIRFFCKRNDSGKTELIFLNFEKNLNRLRKGISFNLSSDQQRMVPSKDEILSVFLRFFREPAMQEFFSDMADSEAQGYFRPFTFDEKQSRPR